MRGKPYYQSVREVLAQNIAEGNIPEGTRLSTAAVSDRLGISRPAVKRALDMLQGDGVLSALAPLGYVVGPLPEGAQPARTNLHQLNLDLPPELGNKFGQPRWEDIFDAVETSILDAIPFGAFRVSEGGIADHFGVSRTVVRDVLSRLHSRGLIDKNRSSHWISGPVSSRMIDEAHEVRRLVEPGALVAALPRADSAALRASLDRVEALLAETARAPEAIERTETDLHVDALSPLRNQSLRTAVRLSQIGLTVNRLFRNHIGVHDEDEGLHEHRLIYEHMLLGDSEGAAVAMRRHLDRDHVRSRARLKVLSVFEAAQVAPYLQPEN